jgi:hypothetical protein
VAKTVERRFVLAARLRRSFFSHIRFDYLAIFSGVAVLYGLTLVKVHTFDALSYTNAVQAGRSNLTTLLNPHHLIYNSLGLIVFRVWTLLGWKGGALLPLQMLNICLGSLGLVLFYILVSRRVERRLAGAVTGALAVTHGYWLYSVEVEVYILSVVFLAATLVVLDHPQAGRRQAAMLAGGLLGGAMLAHQTNILFLLVIAACLWKADFTGKLRWLLYFGITCGVVVLVPYLIAIRLLGLETPAQIAYWLTTYAHLGRWGVLRPNTPLLAVTGLRDALVAARPGFPPILNFLLLPLLAVLFWAAWRSKDKMVYLCLVWFTVYAAFFTWWEPLNLEFWIVPLLPLFLLLALALGRLNAVHFQRGLVGLAVLAPLLAGVNWTISLQPLRFITLDPRHASALAVRACMTKGDKVFVSNYLLAPWLIYYGKVEPFPVDKAFQAAERLGVADVPTEAFTQMRKEIRAALRTRGRVFVAGEAMTTTLLTAKYHLQDADLAAFFNQYPLQDTGCTYTATYLYNSPTFKVYVINQ